MWVFRLTFHTGFLDKNEKIPFFLLQYSQSQFTSAVLQAGAAERCYDGTVDYTHQFTCNDNEMSAPQYCKKWTPDLDPVPPGDEF